MLRYTLLSALVVCAYGAVLPPNVPKWDGKIVGGEPATIEEAPYQVALFVYGGYFCGGSIIADNVILTAAHCTMVAAASNWKVRAGSSYFSTGGQFMDVSDIIIHEGFSVPSNFNNDISLIFLTSQLSLGAGVSPVTLPEHGEDVEDDALAFVTGWGYTSEGGNQPNQLHKVTIPIVNQQKCVEAYLNTGLPPVTDNMICAGNFYEGGQDACRGDSGGPLTVNNKLIGITSWGGGCARPRYPGVWTRVPNYITWIQSHL